MQVQKDEEKREYYMEDTLVTELTILNRLQEIGGRENKEAIEVMLDAFVIYAEYDKAVCFCCAGVTQKMRSLEDMEGGWVLCATGVVKPIPKEEDDVESEEQDEMDKELGITDERQGKCCSYSY